MSWHFPRPRLRVRTLIVVVAVCACGLGLWSAIYDTTGMLIRRLRSDQPVYLRREAASALGNETHSPKVEEAVSALIVALRDPSPRVREYATVGLAGLKRRSLRAVPEIARLLKDDDAFVRYSAVSLLGSVLNPSDPECSIAVPALASVLDDSRIDVRERAARSLVHLERPDLAADVLAQFLMGTDDDLRERTRSLIKRRVGPKDRDLIFALANASKTGEMGARLDAAEVLLGAGRKAEALAVLEIARHHDDPAIRRRAARIRATIEAIEAER